MNFAMETLVLPGSITKSGCDPVRCTWVSIGLKFWLQNQSAKTYLASGIEKPFSISHISFCKLKIHNVSFQGMIALGLSRKEGHHLCLFLVYYRLIRENALWVITRFFVPNHIVMWTTCHWKYRIIFPVYRSRQSRLQFIYGIYLKLQFWPRSCSHFWKLHKALTCSNFLLKAVNVYLCKIKSSSLLLHEPCSIFNKSQLILCKIMYRILQAGAKNIVVHSHFLLTALTWPTWFYKQQCQGN